MPMYSAPPGPLPGSEEPLACLMDFRILGILGFLYIWISEFFFLLFTIFF